MAATSTEPKPAVPPSPISVGIGSWTDAAYTGVIFPKGVRPDERLTVYATSFSHVEVNSSYHRIPRRTWVESWAKQTPPGFLFDFKLHKSVSAAPDKAAREGKMIPLLIASTEPVREAGKFGAYFIVMPPAFGPASRQLAELDALVEKLQPHALAVELRHSGWVGAEHREATFKFFRERKLVWIAVDMPRLKGSTIMPPVDEVTNPNLAYLRLHGRNRNWLKAKSAEERHAYPYPAEELAEIVERVRHLAAQAAAVRVVANNHAEDFAPKTALALQSLLDPKRQSPSPAAETIARP